MTRPTAVAPDIPAQFVFFEEFEEGDKEIPMANKMPVGGITTDAQAQDAAGA